MGTPALSPIMEDYLETIWRLQRSQPVTRVKDIAAAMSVKMPTVTAALRTLAGEGLVTHGRYAHVELTETGRELAQQVSRRHVILAGFLRDVLQVAPEQADREACELEHALTPETLRRLTGLMEFVDQCPRSSGDWLAHMRGRWEDEACGHGCEECIGQITMPRQAPFRHRHGQRGVPLSNQRPGFRGTIVRVAGCGPIRRRLLEMGVTAGTEVEFERVAPLGDPLEIKLRGYHLSLRREEAAGIYVSPTAAGAEAEVLEGPAEGVAEVAAHD
jgi:DtxR family transcriptional regulator, Mn-dependent transcriptional regulator